jgi:hypothetical protein
MNFKQTLIFYKQKTEKYENLSVFYMSLTITYYYKKNWSSKKLYYEN